MNLLHVDSSITGPGSVSRQLSAGLVERLRQVVPDLRVVRRDLGLHPLPYFDAAALGGSAAAPGPQGPEPQAEARPGRAALDEFMAAHLVVVGAPMYNFGVPAQLKTWIDHLAIAGATFRYTPEGPVGLAGGKRVFVASARGGLYGPGSPAASMEHQVSYLLGAFGFFGITDVTVIGAEGLKVGPEQAQHALAAARAQIAALEVRGLRDAA